MESVEGDGALFNRRLNKVLNRARMQDGPCDFHPTNTDPEH